MEVRMVLQWLPCGLVSFCALDGGLRSERASERLHWRPAGASATLQYYTPARRDGLSDA